MDAHPPKTSSWRSGQMHRCFQNGDSPGDTANLYQTSLNSHTLKIQPISHSLTSSHSLHTRGPHTLHSRLLAPHQIGPSAVCWCGVIASPPSCFRLLPRLARLLPSEEGKGAEARKKAGGVAISSLQQPKPRFVGSSNPLPINSADSHTRGPPPFVILSEAQRSRRTY